MFSELIKNEEYLGKMLCKYRSRVFYNLKCKTNNHDDAEDLLQITDLRILISIRKHLFNGNSETDFRNYYVKTSSNIFINYIKNKKIVPSTPNKNEINWFDYESYSEYNEDKENDILKIENVFYSLSQKQKDLLIQHYYNNKSLVDISIEKNTNYNTIKSDQRNIITSIRKKLNIDNKSIPRKNTNQKQYYNPNFIKGDAWNDLIKLLIKFSHSESISLNYICEALKIYTKKSIRHYKDLLVRSGYLNTIKVGVFSVIKNIPNDLKLKDVRKHIKLKKQTA